MSKLNLAEMAEGAFMEQFQREMHTVLENIADPNTDPKKVRKITLTATIKATENRDLASFEVQSKAHIVPTLPIATSILIDRDNNGKVVGAELKSGQKGQYYYDTDGAVKDDRGNVVNLHK